VQKFFGSFFQKRTASLDLPQFFDCGVLVVKGANAPRQEEL
jgi:hypothetical protein